MPDRPLRLCDVCGGLDDHPRHVQVGIGPETVPTREFLDALPADTPFSAIGELMNPQTIVRHMDCCASRGCEICAETEQSYGERRGQELIDHLDAVRGD